MSPVRRTKSSSVESRCSKRFFSRMTCWDFCGFDHRLGSAACLSISARCWRKVLASKVLLEFADFDLQRCVFLLKILDHYFSSPFSFRVLVAELSETAIAPSEIIAHAYANQSPWRV